MVQLYKDAILKNSPKNINEKFFKEQIFKGKILIINSSNQINEILNLCERYFFEIFDISVKKFLKIEKTTVEHNRLFHILQKRIKYCKSIRKKLTNFLEDLGLKPNQTYMDMISIRFTPVKGKGCLGSLKPAKPHRDTWASNIFNQINLWFPIHNVKKEHSIYIIPKYFKKKVQNNSSSWSYSLHKSKNNYPSVPYTQAVLEEKDKISVNLLKGDVLCFSGHHLHGSRIGFNRRINLETRIVNNQDCDLFDIPVNLDSHSKEKKYKWFRNLYSGKYY